MITYRGLPAPIVCDFISHERSRGQYSEGTEFQIGLVTMAANTGTYVDSPFHRHPGGVDVSHARFATSNAIDEECTHK